MRLLLTLTPLVLAVLPASASAHAVVGSDAGRISWRSADADSPSTLTVTVAGDRIRFHDPTEHGGMSTTRGCDPGAVDSQGFIREVTCPRAGVTEIFIDLDGGDDKARVDVPLPITASGRFGNDTITTSGADDTLFGGDGNDVLEPGAGSDVVQGEAGDDEAKVRDGVSDQVVCAEGNDRVESDDRDTIAADAGCETVNGAATPPPPPGGGGPGGDAVAPRIEVTGGRSQRARRGRFTLRIGVDEPARLSLSGVMRTGGRSYRLSAVRAATTAPGVRRMTVRLSARARRALRRGRRAVARISVLARDAAGNAARLKVTVRLRA
jgi:hypothetical protein